MINFSSPNRKLSYFYDDNKSLASDIQQRIQVYLQFRFVIVLFLDWKTRLFSHGQGR